MIFESFFSAIQDSAFGVTVAESSWMFPTVESLHVVAITTVFGTIAIVDFRLLGLISKDRPVTVLSDDVLPWTWWAFVGAALTGLLMFVSRAHDYMQNTPFLVKMSLIVLAGLNMAVFQFYTFRRIHLWDNDAARLPITARVAGGLSLTLWTAVIFLGRWVGFI